MAPESGVVLGDPLHRRLDRHGRVQTRSLRGRADSALPAAEASRARELVGQKPDLFPSLRRALEIVESLGFRQLLAKIFDPLPIVDPGLRVEHLSRVAKVGRAAA